MFSHARVMVIGVSSDLNYESANIDLILSIKSWWFYILSLKVVESKNIKPP